jgi:ribonucleoside-diphosphate reductase alpha chain
MIKVTKRDGSKEDFDISKVKQSIAYACANAKVNPLELESRIDYFLKNGIRTEDIQLNIIEHAKQLATAQDPEWLLVAGHAFAMHQHHSYKLKNKSFAEIVKHAVQEGFYDKTLLDAYTEDDLNFLETVLNLEKDNYCSYAALLTNATKYQNKFELNQHMHMVNAMRLGQTVSTNRMEFVKSTYATLSDRKFSLATPFMSNLRSGGNTASCFIISIEDDIDSIFTNIHRIAKISKNGGGLGIYLGNLRAKGSSVGKAENASNTVVQWVKIINDTLVAVNQGGKRAGAGTVALPVWHNDILDFLDMQTEHGDIRLKAFDVFPQVTVPDLFLQRDKENAKWTTFCPFEVKTKLNIDVRGLYGKEFEEAYGKIEAAAAKGKLKISRSIQARDLTKQIMRIQFETGLPYIAFVDTINDLNPNKSDIKAVGIPCANLCVAPETLILTDEGYQQIAELEGEQVNVWNGKEFSNVLVRKTGENQKLLRVITNSGFELECTPYHKFYVTRRDNSSRTAVFEKRACELKAGDKLIKSDFPIIQGTEVLDHAYENGFYTADGCLEPSGQRVYFYHEKRKLKDFIDMSIFRYWNVNEAQNREYGTTNVLKDKFFVPIGNYTIESKIRWLEGFLDGDGVVCRNGKTQSIQGASINKDFLLEVQMMLQTMGVSSKVTKMHDEGLKMMPANDGTGDSKEYFCQTSWRIMFGQSAIVTLQSLGFTPKRLSLTNHVPNRECSQFVKIVDVVDEGRIDDTFCFSEPKRHMGVFNGILTGQCTESFSNVVADKYGHVCNLGSINMGNIFSFEELAQVSRLACRVLNAGVDLTDHPDIITKQHNERYRTIGIGVMGLHDYLAREFTNFSNLKLISKIFECIEYNAVLESTQLAKEKGSFEAFDYSEWKNGNRTKIFKELGCGEYDWDYVQSQIDLYGMYNSQLTSPAPTTSTSISQDASASVLPIYSAFFSEDNKTGSIKVSAKYLKENPLGYGKTQAKFSATEIIDAVAEMQKFTDTGISMELIFDQNKPDFKAKDLYDAIHYAHSKKLKTIYYIRSVKQKEQGEEACVACAG